MGAAPAQAADVGRGARGRGAEEERSGRGAAQAAGGREEEGGAARDGAAGAGGAEPAAVQAGAGDADGVSADEEEGRVPAVPVLDPARPPAPGVRGGLEPGAVAGDAGARDQLREARQSRARAEGKGLRRSVPRREAHVTAADAECALLHHEQRAPARGATRSDVRWGRSVLVGLALRWLDARSLAVWRRSSAGGAVRRAGRELASEGGLAAARGNRRQRGAGEGTEALPL